MVMNRHQLMPAAGLAGPDQPHPVPARLRRWFQPRLCRSSRCESSMVQRTASEKVSPSTRSARPADFDGRAWGRWALAKAPPSHAAALRSTWWLVPEAGGQRSWRSLGRPC